jgi:hypothetical protein
MRAALEDTEYAEAFTLAWIVIEKYLAQLWRDFLREKKIAGERKHKLADHVFWSTDYVIEVLSLVGTMDVERYHLLMDLKSKRNGFIHEGDPITKDDAVACVGIAEGIVEQGLEGLL